MATMKGTRRDGAAVEAFWTLAAPLLEEEGVVKGSIMNFPCLRQGEEFFGMPHHESGDAVLKLPRQRVLELIEQGVGEPFGPGKKVFKEWVLIRKQHQEHWWDLLQEARAFAGA